MLWLAARVFRAGCRRSGEPVELARRKKNARVRIAIRWRLVCRRGNLPAGLGYAMRDLRLSESDERKFLYCVWRPACPGGRRFARKQTRASGGHLTVLFSDLVVSTEISSHLDPEQWHEVARTIQRATGEAIAKSRPCSQVLGDGLVAYFGYLKLGGRGAASCASRLAIVRAVGALNGATRRCTILLWPFGLPACRFSGCRARRRADLTCSAMPQHRLARARSGGSEHLLMTSPVHDAVAGCLR